MKISKILVCLLFSTGFLSCNKHINVFKTGTLLTESFIDTFSYSKNDKFIVIPAKVDNVNSRLIFDTGADLVVFPKNNTDSKIKINLGDSNGNTNRNEINIIPINSVGISNNNIQNIYSINLLLPAPFLCFCDGIVGNNVLRSCNWFIGKDKIMLSDKPFTIEDHKLLFDIFYYGSNSLNFNVKINEFKIDTIVIDYGASSDDIILSREFYEKNKDIFKPEEIITLVSSSYGANGRSVADTITRLNCNIDFNGIKLNNVRIEVVKNVENRIGLRFLKRFEEIAINNSDDKIIFGDLDMDYNTYQKELPVLFDYTKEYFEIKEKTIDPEFSELNVGDKFIEINSVKISEIKSYCDFLDFSDKLNELSVVELKTIDNKIIKIDNKR